ncbi:MAG: DUF4956 domain-containing protein [Planctomycetes bacterium]|nr:DUF4956 domain-containing protein [Planctomycetota bacterium]
MGRLGRLEATLSVTQHQHPLAAFVLHLLLSAALAAALAAVYARYGRALSNRGRFASNFVLLAATTTLIITIVKSSLALSLGLVGALSIVRFRAAIKEPEELAYLFCAIAIGLGCGAQQTGVTLAGSFLIVAFLILRRRAAAEGEAASSLHLTVSGPVGGAVTLERIAACLREHCAEVSLKRFDESDKGIEASFAVTLAGLAQLDRARAALRGLGDSVQVLFLDLDRDTG